MSGILRGWPFSSDLFPSAVGTGMDDSARTMLAGLTMAEVHPLRLSRQDCSERTAMAVRNSFHDNLHVPIRLLRKG